MNEPQPKIATRCAHWGWDDHRYFGLSVFKQLAGQESMISMSALSVLGRQLPKESCDVLEDILSTSTLADPRIWPLKITRLVASYGATMPAVGAGLLMQEGARVGPWATVKAAEVLAGFHRQFGSQLDDTIHVRQAVEDYLAHHDYIPGFGTPYRKADERLARFNELIHLRGRDAQPHWQTMLAVARQVRSLRSAEPNIGVGYGAAMLDMGLQPAEIGPLTTLLLHHMFYANAVEASQQSNALLRKLPDEFVRYVGVPMRDSPRRVLGVSFFRGSLASRTG